jgi:hypothetical protein
MLGRPLVSGTLLARTLLSVEERAMELNPIYKRVIALDVHQAKITACAPLLIMAMAAWR